MNEEIQTVAMINTVEERNRSSQGGPCIACIVGCIFEYSERHWDIKENPTFLTALASSWDKCMDQEQMRACKIAAKVGD